jgi:hypothetical protein
MVTMAVVVMVAVMVAVVIHYLKPSTGELGTELDLTLGKGSKFGTLTDCSLGFTSIYDLESQVSS